MFKRITNAFTRKKSPISAVPSEPSLKNNAALPAPLPPKHHSSVLNALKAAPTNELNDPSGRRNSTASMSTVASDPRSRVSSFASSVQENLIQNRLNHPLNIAGQEEQRRAEEEARNIAAHEARIQQWVRNNRVATMKRKGANQRPVGVTSPVANVALNWSTVPPIPVIPRKKKGTRRNNRTKKNRRN